MAIISGEVYSSTSTPSVLPSFRILSDSDTPSQARFRIRPAALDEKIPDPFSDPTQSRTSDWVLEYIPDVLPGLVVRRNWLNKNLQGEGPTTNELRVEQLLVSPLFFPFCLLVREEHHDSQEWEGLIRAVHTPRDQWVPVYF